MHDSDFTDYIGLESCADLKSDMNNPPRSGGRSDSRRIRPTEAAAAEKEYPPPIPWLARTENLPSHMPWVMQRYYSGDGRLIIREEKVKRHEYFQVHRSNGRLVLNLVPLDDAVEESRKDRHAHGGEEEEEQGKDDKIDGGDEGICDPTVEETVSRCYKFNSVGINVCGGFAAVAAAAATFRPPVQI
ncbi:hypothetical protein DH2020_035546 [Rehmannia glutinosa]|uniref:FAF domain-containing protein n=1 Tax=Rehmannia glutinosa TaxID=99300 RepID=A0ABR0V9H1_REHGL